MWTIDEHGNATNGVDKCIFVQPELSTRFDVALVEKIDGRLVYTQLKNYLLERVAREFVRKLVEVINTHGEDAFVKIAHVYEEAHA